MNHNFTFKKYGLMIVLFFLSTFSLYGQSAEREKSLDTSYRDELVLKAKTLKLSTYRYWHVLLHYLDEPLCSCSQIDDPAFFLSPDGSFDAQAELEATIRAFFTEKEEGTVHPSLRFPARFEWLKDELDIDRSRLPYDPGEEIADKVAAIDPAALYVIFPSGYIESPASMFGHTFLLIERGGLPWHKGATINYAAVTDETNGPVFAFKGLFGFYKGYYSYLPYYKKISEYNDIDVRDMWEYKLNFTDTEIRRLIYHMIELENIYSYYYFLDENCSYNLLFLLESGRSSLDLVDKFTFACEPVDSLREIIRQGAVERISYRPSKLKKIHHYAAKLSKGQVDYAIDLGRGRKKVTGDELEGIARDDREKALILDLAADYSQYLLAKDYIEVGQYRSSFFSIIKMRSTIDYTVDESSDIPVPYHPENSHYSKKAGIAAGAEDGDFFSEFHFRFTNNSLMDDYRGLNRNSQLIFGNLFVRYFPLEQKVALQRFDIVAIDSLSSSTKFGLRPGMLLKSGWYRDIVAKERQLQTTYYINGGTSLAADVSIMTLYGSVMYYQAHSSAFDYWTSCEPGVRAGALVEWGIWKGRVEGQYRRALFINEHNVFAVSAEQRLVITKNDYLVAGGMFKNSFKRDFVEYSFGYEHCFR